MIMLRLDYCNRMLHLRLIVVLLQQVKLHQLHHIIGRVFGCQERAAIFGTYMSVETSSVPCSSRWLEILAPHNLLC
jgi:hypothetical protein